MQIETHHHTLVLHGDFDARSTDAVRDALHDLEAVEQHVVVDLSDVHFVDLTALRVLAFASLDAARTGQHVSLRGVGPQARRMLHLSRLIRVVDLEDAVPA